MSHGPIVYPPLPEDLQQGLSWRSIKYFGAGAIVASVTIASGESLFAARSGALFGYTFLWCFVAALVMKGVQVYSGGRYMVLTGEHPMTHWAYLPGPKNWVPITIALLSLVCFPFWQAGLPLMLGNILNWIFGIPETDPHLLGLRPRLGYAFDPRVGRTRAARELRIFGEGSNGDRRRCSWAACSRPFLPPGPIGSPYSSACSRPPSPATRIGCSRPTRRSSTVRRGSRS